MISIRRLFILLLINNIFCQRSRIYMTKKPEPLIAPIGDEVGFECEMSIKPDKFLWRQFHLSENNDMVQFNTRNAINMTSKQFRTTGRHSRLLVKVDTVLAAGDYQCLAYYGASVVVSVPARLTIAEIGRFPKTENTSYTVTSGNSITLQCGPPFSQPAALIKYYKNGELLDTNLILPTGSILLQNISRHDSGNYTCLATNYINGDTVYSDFQIGLNVVNYVTKHEPPKFLNVPRNNYTIIIGKTLFMECTAYGSPPPIIKWSKLSDFISPHRAEQVPGGLRIVNVTTNDQGIYECQITNGQHAEPLSYHISLIVLEPPSAQINGITTKQIKEGEHTEFDCNISIGKPEPKVHWLLNGHNVIYDKSIEAVSNRIYFMNVEKRHAGVLQCFATNQVGSACDLMFLSVYPKQLHQIGNKPYHSIDESNSLLKDLENNNRLHNGKKRKHPKNRFKTNNMIPPSKPYITRLSDESVMVRWSVPKNNGVPISFFKIQYKNLGSINSSEKLQKVSDWKTTNSDIPLHVNSFEIDNLVPDHYYRFRVAAVYTNNDHQLGQNSAKFLLRRADFFARNPLPVPKLTHTEAFDSSSIKIFWEFEPNENLTVDGFYIHYLSGNSAGDYIKATVEGQDTREFTIRYLEPDTYYDVKMQSFTSQIASEFSGILKQKTSKFIKENTTTVIVEIATTESTAKNIDEFYNLYNVWISIIAGILFVILLIFAVVMLRCRKVEKTPNSEGGINKVNGGIVDDFKSQNKHLSNGTLNNNQIKITPNPLAAVDYKQNENVIEMSCLPKKSRNSKNDSSSSIHLQNHKNDNEIFCNLKNSLNRKNSIDNSKLTSKHLIS